ncbi:MAG: DNA adenine methylase [Myxococcota bacterium]
MPAPFIKWAGGKSKVLEHLLTRRPVTYRRYFEPFLGGGALFFRLTPERAVISDLNPDLINTYRCVAWHVEAVIRRLRTHQRNHNQEYYYQMRDAWNGGAMRSDVARAAGFIYLNKTCYNGLYRVNRRGQFNVPVGRYDNPPICEAPKLRAASRLLQRADLSSGHFAEQVTSAGPGDFVYFDPPYDPLNRTSNFTSYTASSFGEEDQYELASVVGDLTDRGAFVMVSSSDTPYIRNLYRGFKIDQVPVNRAINSRASARGAVSELIITNGYVI